MYLKLCTDRLRGRRKDGELQTDSLWRARGFLKIATADYFTRELAGTGRILRKGQSCREMPARAAYHYKRRDKGRIRGMVSIILK